jgi:drug/metabolite transporter (DMT)-like permease
VNLSQNSRGAIFMVIAMAAFTMNDSLTKNASLSMNMGQVMLIRGIFATVFVLAMAWHRGALQNLRHMLHPMALVRAVAEVGGTVTFLLALAKLPQANVSAVLQALPLAVTMGAALIWGETVGWRRWLAIAAGFIGVTIIIRPGFDGFSPYTLLVLVSVGFCTMRDLATKHIPNEIPTLLISSMTAAAIGVAGLVLIWPMGGWVAPSAVDTGLLGLCAVLLLIGYQFVIASMRTGEISFVAPFRYTSLLCAILLGYLLFGDVPDMAMIVGASIIVASGLYTLYRESVVGRRLASVTAEPALASDGL